MSRRYLSSLLAVGVSMFLIAGCETPPATTDGGGEDTGGEDTGEPPPDEVVKPKSGLIVEGNVFDADTGTPVRNVIVRVLGFPKFASNETNNIGDFKLELTDEDLKEIGEDYNLFVDPNGAHASVLNPDGQAYWLPTLHGEVLFVKDGSKTRADGTAQVVHVCPTADRGGTPGVWGGPSGLNVGETPTEAEAGVLARASIAILFVDVTKVADGFQFPDMVPGTTVTIDEDGTDYAGLGGYFAPFEEFVAAAGGDADARSLDFDAKESNDLAGFLSMASPDPVDKGAVFRMKLTVENPDYLTTEREVRTGEGYQTVALFLMVPK